MVSPLIRIFPLRINSYYTHPLSVYKKMGVSSHINIKAYQQTMYIKYFADQQI